MTQSHVERKSPRVQFSPYLSGTAYERAYAIVRRCGSDPAIVERNGTFTVHCPAHNDRTPSLRVTPSVDKALLHCWAGCPAQAICAAIGITLSDLFADDLPSAYPKPSRKRTSSPPDNVPLQLAVSFLIDDPAMLKVEGLREVLRQAYRNPVERLWIEKELSRNGMSASVVWDVALPEERLAQAKQHRLPSVLRRSL